MHGSMEYHAPLDPDCPDVTDFMEMEDDPLMQESGCFGEFMADFERRHRRTCKRCQAYGAENIEVRERGL